MSVSIGIEAYKPDRNGNTIRAVLVVDEPDLTPAADWEFVGTVQAKNRLVWHVFVR